MPSTFTYPGIYIEEVPSGVHAIAGVSTAETAFVDFFARGPVDRAVRITSLGDFERVFGGLDSRSEASYAIQQYYLNGGQIAWVVRMPVGNPDTASITLTGAGGEDSLVVSASNPGEWGDRLQVAVIQGTAADRFDVFVQEFTMVGTDKVPVQTEEFRGLSMATGDRRSVVDTVNAQSALVTVAKAAPDAPAPTASAASASGGADPGAFQALTGGGDGDAFDDEGNLTTPGGVTAYGNAMGDALELLKNIDPYIFNILCMPGTALLTDPTGVLGAAIDLCEEERAFLIVDPPDTVTKDDVVAWKGTNASSGNHAALYFPRLVMADPLNEGRDRNVGPSGTMAGLYARTDANRGVWKAPAGTGATIRGATVAAKLNDQENGALNPMGVNVIRNLPIFGNVAWGARTLEGADQQASEWKYIPVRRTALYIEESLRQGLQWVVFEPNDEPLWSQIRLNVGAFMQTLFRQGAFQGQSPREAYFVKCDKETTTQADIDRGVVNILVGFAPLKPAEFVVIRIQQVAGQPQS